MNDRPAIWVAALLQTSRLRWSGLFLVAWLLLVSPGVARTIHLTVLHTADMEGQLRPMAYREHPDQHGGLLRCASAIQAERDRSEHLLLVDCGGFLWGSAESWVSDGALGRRAAAWLRYDVMLPDERWVQDGPEAVGLPGARVWSNPFAMAGSPPVPPVQWFRYSGLRVAVLGVLASSAHPGGSDLDVQHRLRRILREVREEGAQMIVLLYRRLVEEREADALKAVRQLATMFPEIDLVLGSGPSRAVRRFEVNGTVYSQAGARGRELGRVEWIYDTVQRSGSVASCDLLTIDADVPESSDLRQVLGSELSRATFQLDQVLAQNRRSLAGTSDWPGQSGVQHLLCRALVAATGADVVLIQKRARAGLKEGGIRLKDLFRLAPFRDAWVELQLVGPEIRDLLDENLALLDTPDFLGCHGIRYDADPSQPGGSRISSLRLADGSPMHGRKRWRVLVPARVLQESEESRGCLQRLADAPIVRMRRLDIDTQSALVEYVKTVDELDLKAMPGLHRIP